MNKDSKIYIAGHTGLAGSAIVRRLISLGYSNLLFRTSTQLDLRIQQNVNDFFVLEKPEYVFFAAGKVGGIHANKTFPANFIYDNAIMIANIAHASYINGVKKLINLGSNCVYPKITPQPIKEEYLCTGQFEKTSEPYSISKLFGINLCHSYNLQYKTNFISLIPANLFGINDNYHLENSHFIAAIIRKLHEAKINKKDFLELWGTGNSRRELLCSDDLADACVYFMNVYSGNEMINIGTEVDYPISRIVEMIQNVVGYQGEIKFDINKPDGAPQKILDITRSKKLGWCAKGILEEDLKRVYNDFNQNSFNYIK